MSFCCQKVNLYTLVTELTLVDRVLGEIEKKELYWFAR